jgi:XTP/dITP diphosphohydrolase
MSAPDAIRPAGGPAWVAGTRNRGKLAELREILGEAGIPVLPLDEFPAAPEVEESGTTFEENARLKALTLARALGRVVLAEDAGLEVDALGGAPGPRSARFAGEPQDPRKNNELLLRRLAGVPLERRTARFRCAACLASPDGILAESEGATEGRILFEPRGAGGFGYDPLFFSLELRRSFAEAPSDAKNAVSHRGRALRALLGKARDLDPALLHGREASFEGEKG